MMANRKNGMRRYEGMHNIVPGLYLSGMAVLQVSIRVVVTAIKRACIYPTAYPAALTNHFLRGMARKYARMASQQ